MTTAAARLASSKRPVPIISTVVSPSPTIPTVQSVTSTSTHGE
jgi:hypothetical protein